MAQRPLYWAIGIFVGVGLGMMNFGTRLATFTGRSETVAAVTPPPAGGAKPAPAPAARPAIGPAELVVAADAHGQFLVHPSIDNFRVRMLVDTGASIVALTAEDARALGVRPAASEYRMELRTANGTVRGARVRLREIRLGSILVRDVDAVVLPAGALSVSLLGTSFLGKLKGYEVQTGRMILKG